MPRPVAAEVMQEGRREKASFTSQRSLNLDPATSPKKKEAPPPPASSSSVRTERLKDQWRDRHIANRNSASPLLQLILSAGAMTFGRVYLHNLMTLLSYTRGLIRKPIAKSIFYFYRFSLHQIGFQEIELVQIS